MVKGYIPPTRKMMNEGIMPSGVPPTLAQIKKGARLSHKPYTIYESRLMKKYKTDLRTARELEKEERNKFSEFL